MKPQTVIPCRCGCVLFGALALACTSTLSVAQETKPDPAASAQPSADLPEASTIIARYIEAIIGTIRVASLYLPNGNPVDTDKFSYKLRWMERLTAHARALLDYEETLVLGGDFNICPTDDDVYDPEGFAGDALCHPESRARFRTLSHLGLTDAVRLYHPQKGVYSFWDYQGGCWNYDQGLRIDHFLLSPQAADRLVGSGIDKGPRAKDKPSDHTPVWCELADV